MKENNRKKKSLLDSMEKNVSGGFSVPENYFDMLSASIENKVLSIPNLASLPKENVFEVPDGYFARLENSIRENISSQTESIIIPAGQWFRRPKLVAAFASVLVLFIAASTFFLSNVNHRITDKDISFSDIYNSEYVNELDETSLASLLEEPAASPSSTQFEDYIIDNNVDISTITEEL